MLEYAGCQEIWAVGEHADILAKCIAIEDVHVSSFVVGIVDDEFHSESEGWITMRAVVKFASDVDCQYAFSIANGVVIEVVKRESKGFLC